MLPFKTAVANLPKPDSTAVPHFHGPILNNPSLLATALDLPLQRQFSRRVASGEIPLDPVLRSHLNQNSDY